MDCWHFIKCGTYCLLFLGNGIGIVCKDSWTPINVCTLTGLAPHNNTLSSQNLCEHSVSRYFYSFLHFSFKILRLLRCQVRGLCPEDRHWNTLYFVLQKCAASNNFSHAKSPGFLSQFCVFNKNFMINVCQSCVSFQINDSILDFLPCLFSQGCRIGQEITLTWKEIQGWNSPCKSINRCYLL